MGRVNLRVRGGYGEGTGRVQGGWERLLVCFGHVGTLLDAFRSLSRLLRCWRKGIFLRPPVHVHVHAHVGVCACMCACAHM